MTAGPSTLGHLRACAGSDSTIAQEKIQCAQTAWILSRGAEIRTRDLEPPSQQPFEIPHPTTKELSTDDVVNSPIPTQPVSESPDGRRSRWPLDAPDESEVRDSLGEANGVDAAVEQSVGGCHRLRA